MKIHIVQKGDTLWKLAQKYGVQFEELKSLNSQLSDPDMIMPGMKIKIPVSGKGSASKGNTKINMGAKKEVPIVSPVQKKEYMKPKEMPVAKPKEVPVAKPKEMPVMPQPIVPEIDINNYYMVNMAKMDIHKPAVQPKPIVMKKEKPIKEKIVPKPQAPVVTEQCIPVTPIMPGTGFCPPFFPIYHPFHDAVMPDCMIQPLHEQEESSSLWESSSHTQMPIHSGPYTEPVNPMFMGSQDCMPQMPIASVHGMQHHCESSSFPFDESSSHVGMESSSHFKPDGHHMGPMMMQQPVIPSYTQPTQKKEDCGCGGPKPLGSTMKQSTYIPQTSMPTQPMYGQQPMMSQPSTKSQTSMPNQPMYSQQPMMSQPSTKSQISMPNQPMYSQQPMMSQPSTTPQTSMPNQPMYSQQPMMSQPSTTPQTSMPTQPMYGQQSMMSQPGTTPQTSMPAQPMYGQQQAMTGQPGTTPQTSMPTQPMYGQQPMMGQPGTTPQASMPAQPMYGQQQAMTGQPNFTQQSMVPAYQPVHGQPHITTDRANYSQPTAPLMGYENRPFINQMEAVFPGMPQPSSEDALSMPRYADESYG